METKDRIIVALDVDKVDKAIEIVNELKDEVGYFKIGLQFITYLGHTGTFGVSSSSLRELFTMLDGKIFWDGKFDDIPNTVGKATEALSHFLYNIKMFNVHASAGTEAMQQAVKNRGHMLALAVTVLTSLSESSTGVIFGSTSVQTVVMTLALMAREVGMDGIICSPKELTLLRNRSEFDNMLMVTPGIRPKWSVADDQKRITTPAEAIKAGADYLVIGRPITNPPGMSRKEAVTAIVNEIEGSQS